MIQKGQISGIQVKHNHSVGFSIESIVLDKSIFSNVFEKDIRRVYLYKRTERIAKALSVILPAFKDAQALKDRIGDIAIRIVDAATKPMATTKEVLSRELLTLSGVLSMARSGGVLSSMNAEIITKEAQNLLQELALYDEPRIELEETPTLASLSKMQARPAFQQDAAKRTHAYTQSVGPSQKRLSYKGHEVKDNKKDREESILSVLREKGPSDIKDISGMIRGVSEKTIQRELTALISFGRIKKTGERRWTTYQLSETEDPTNT